MAIFSSKHENMPLVKDYYTVCVDRYQLKQDIALMLQEKEEITDEDLILCILSTIFLENYLYDSTICEMSIIDNNHEINTIEYKVVSDKTVKEFCVEFMRLIKNQTLTHHGSSSILVGCCGTESVINHLYTLCYFYTDIVLEENNIIIQCMYNINELYHDEIVSYMDRLKCLVCDVFRNPNAKIAEIELEKNPLKWYQFRETNLPSDSYIIPEFKKIVSKYKNRKALSNAKKSYTYEELDLLSDNIAMHLVTINNVGNGKVALYSRRSVEYVILLLAILKSGCSFIPIDNKLPEQRIHSMIKQANADVVVSTLKTELNFGVRYIFIDTNLFENRKIKCMLPEKYSSEAYTLFTSGTTGNPKGAVILQNSVVNMKGQFTEDFSICHNDIVGQFASISFDASISEIFMALLLGGELYVYSEDEINNVHTFVTNSVLNHVTVVTLPPTYSQLIDFSKFTSLRLLITAGSICSVEQYLKMSKYVTVMNAYGPTECTVCSTIWKNDSTFFYHGIPIGKPVPGLRVYILNEQKKIQPPYVQGEIYISGMGVGGGYVGNQEETAKRFLPDILNPKQRMYKTGDYGRILPDGNIEFWGRNDNQVKYNGIRIELSEITRVAETMPGITNAYTKLYNSSQTKLCLYYVTDLDISEENLRRYISQRIPNYALPNYIVRLDHFIINNSGKIDGLSLEEPTPEKEIIRKEKMQFEYIFEKYLAVKDINIEENFTNAGGSSLACIGIINDLEEEFGIHLKLELFYNSSSIGELFDIIASMITKM